MIPFDPHTHTHRGYPETSFEAAESLVGGGAQAGIMKMLWGWYDLGWAGGNYKMATDKAALRWSDWNRDKASPRSTDCKQLDLVEPVLDHLGNHKKTDKAFWFRITRKGCAEIGVPYLFGLPPNAQPPTPAPPPPIPRLPDGHVDLDAMRERLNQR